MSNDIPLETLAESENYIAWITQDDGEDIYHVELGSVTLHFFREEWLEFVKLVAEAADAAPE